ncbi:MAG TPA: crotonase/enoyl-CoA hydratase family protein [Myxococcota bacterium]|nr:crotonase/enoyl-CoA hydratase family protein [Myxococcota bacterium]
MSYEHIRYDVERGRARITLNRPERRNALCNPLLEELERALWDADDDARVHCVIVRGAGPAFCAGYDLTGFGSDRPRGATSSATVQAERSEARSEPEGRAEFKRTGRTIDDDAWLLERNQRRLRALWEMHKPSIAQVHGHCLAGGTDLALYCDMVIAAEDARIGFPPARNLGALPNNLWVYHCGPQWAKRLQLTGDVVSGADAAKIGLVLKAVPADQLEAEVEGLADRLALIDRDLLSTNKRVINLALELMGASVLQRLAAENDARGHLAPGTRDYFRAVKEKGLAGAFKERDAKFGDGRARVEGPELRDDRGYLIEPEK